MNRIKDEIMLFVLISILLLYEEINIRSMATVLITIIIVGMIYLLGSQKSACVLIALYFIIAMLEPKFCFYMPLIFYLCISNGFSVLILGSLPMDILFLVDNASIERLFILPAMILSVYMEQATRRRELLESAYHELRDSGEEIQRLLKEKNQALIDQVEYEIHVATLKERNRISREIHDHVGHMLSRALLQTGAIMTVNKQPVVDDLLFQLKDTLDTAMNNIRESVHDLHNDSMDLKLEIEKVIQTFSAYEIEFEYDVVDDLDKNSKYCFLATVREGLTNVAKHSDATKIAIYVFESNSSYQLNIKDNGSAEKKMDQEGIGLINMKERAEALEGIFKATFRDGFQIYMSVPKQNAMSKERMK